LQQERFSQKLTIRKRPHIENLPAYGEEAVMAANTRGKHDPLPNQNEKRSPASRKGGEFGEKLNSERKSVSSVQLGEQPHHKKATLPHPGVSLP